MATAPHCEDGCSCCAGCNHDHPLALPRQVAWLQGVTLTWMTLECAGALVAAVRAHSVALAAFGSDSLIELLSAVVVLLQFSPRLALKKETANRAASALLFLLAGAIVGIALVSWRRPAETSWLGIAVTALALVAMPVLAWLKRGQARVLGNPALAADAAQSATCAYMAAVTLAGSAAQALWHIGWIDTVTALAVVPIVAVEARRAWRGEECGCCGNVL